MDFQSNKPSRASSVASLGVGLGVRETRFAVNSYFPGMVDDESLKEYGAEAPLGGYMYGLFAPACGRPYAGYGEDMLGLNRKSGKGKTDDDSGGRDRGRDKDEEEARRAEGCPK